ncbi:NAD(P)-dependent oxidoreductase [Pseudomonas palleroniana]|uniref:NAD(P)-dependent oxidoreductase n=1 Tax=Pseudomonas palleroniana TaxID=191390 RepID=A0A2L1J5Q0_9PSED|nr:SDR family oxidoreductase [Pseudomonas palleroniana]AVE03805.1 NAD(P)-dependent oxidoreductase [Pseudomonas palleroniana]
MIDLSQQVFWVTGASGAIGRAICEHLHQLGGLVVASGRNLDSLPESRPGLQRRVVDVTDRHAVDAAAHDIQGEYGRIDGLVTCTTIPGFGDFLTLPDEGWTAVLDTKLMGSIRPARAVIPAMIDQGRGSIVFISGRGGSVPPPRHLPGACANSALNLLAQGLATEYGQYGIRINSLAPGPIESPRLEQMKAGVANSRSALGGAGKPEDVAHAVSFLLSPSSRHMTGICLPVDGGRAR